MKTLTVDCRLCKHCYWNSLDVHDIVKRVIEFVKTLKNIKKAEMKFEQCYWFLSRMLIYLMRQRTMKMIFHKRYWNVINENEILFAGNEGQKV